MLTRLRDRGREESGVVLILVAIMMVVFLGIAALAIDIGSFYKAQTQAQSAADAGALAASQDLPGSASAAVSDGTTYAQNNFPGATATVSTPYNGNSNQVKVTVNAQTPSFFGQIFGITYANVSASAVANEHGTTQHAAIFAYADGGNCSSDIGINIAKNNTQIGGAIESDGNITANGQGTTSIGAGVYGTGSGCTCSCSSGNFTTAPFASAPVNYPIDYRANPPACTVNETGNYTFSGTVSPGVYCDASGTFNFSGATGTGVTFEASGITVSGGANLQGPAAGNGYGLLLYQTGCDVSAGNLTINGNGETLDGTIFAPCATVNIAMNNSSTGFIEANNVLIAFNNFMITGDGPVVTATGDALSQ